MVEGGGPHRPDLWPWHKEVLATVEAAMVERRPGARPRLERLLRAVEPDFKTLLRNPPPSPQDADMIRKATTEGIKLPGSDVTTTLSPSLVEEALIVSELFKLNELSSALLLLHGEDQLPQHPGLTRGLVAVLLYYDGRKALVQALKTLVAGRTGSTWSTDTQPDIAELVQETTAGLMAGGLADTLLELLATLDWTVDLAALQKASALGDAQHVHTVAGLHADIRQGLADCLYCYSAQSGLSGPAVTAVLDHLAKAGPGTAAGALDGVTSALLMAVLAAMDVSAAGREEMAEPAFLAAVSREVEGRGRKWECPGLLAVLQLAWATVLAGLRQGQGSLGSTSSTLEEDEMFVELALEGRVFHCLPGLLLASPATRKEEFYLRRLHGVLTDFLTLLPLKVKEMRNRADDAARNQLMHEQEGIQYTVPLAGQHFGQLLASLALLYRGDPLGLQLASLYWCPTEGAVEQARHYPAKQVALYKFVRLAGDLLMPSLFVPYVTMLTGLADSASSAPHCFKLLKLNGASSSNVCLDHFFQSLSQYHGNLQQSSRQAGPEHTIYRTQPLTKGISPQEVAGLVAVLDLVTVLADRSEAARLAMAEHPGWSAVPTVLGLLACSVPTSIKARLVGLLTALARSPDIVHPLWLALEGAGLVAPGGRGLVAELEEVEARAEEFPLTLAFIGLLDRLTDAEIPGGLGAGQRAPGFQPYLAFVQDSVFLRFQARTYREPGERWAVAAACLRLLHKLVAEYEPRPEDFQGGTAGLGLGPGFHVLCHLHQTSQLLRTVLFVVDEARSLLDAFSPFPGKESLEAAATAALGLLDTSLRLSEAFIACGRTAGASVVLTGLPHLLLGLNPRSGKPDHLLNVSRFVLFGYWLPAARLAAVRVIAAVAASPAHQPAILATFTATPAIANAVLKAFTEALDGEEEEEDSTRLAVVELLQAGLLMPAPSLAHFLCGFDLAKGVSRCQLQSPQVTGVRTPLHALLSLLAPAATGAAPAAAAAAPVLLTAAHRLVFTLASSPATSEPALRYIRSQHQFLPGQLAGLTDLLGPGSVQAQRSAAWLLRTVAVEVRALARGRQASHLARILGLLLDTAGDGEAELGPGGGPLYQDSTFSQLSRTVAHSSGRQTDTASSVHRLALVLNTIDFEMEAISAPTWELFDDGQVAGVLSQCQTQNPDSSSQELLVDVPKLHKILAAELSAIQGSAAMNQRVLIQAEIESILTYAAQWNKVQEGAAARRDLLDAWRQVTETLINVIPPALLPAAGKQQVLLQLLQSLLNKVSGEGPVPGMDTLVSSTVLLLLTALRSTYSAAPGRRDVMGETFVGLLDAVATEGSGQSQTYSASLQVVLKGLVSWLLTSGAGSQTIRTNLYAALLAHLRIGHSAGEAGKGGGLLELSDGARLQQANLEVVQSYGTNLLEVLARDATTGHDVRRMLALAVLDELVGLDRQAATTIRFLSCQGFFKHLVESLAADQAGLAELLTKPGGNVRYLYVFEAKLGLLVRAASHPAGAELLLQAGLMARLAELSLLSLRPDLDTALLQQSGEGGALQRYHAVLFPVLRLCLAVLASLGGDNVSAAAQVLQFLTGHEETVSLVLRGATARAALHPALLQELALLTAVVSRAAGLDLRPEHTDAASIELAGQQARLQRQMLALLTQFQLTDELAATLGSAGLMLPVLQIVSNCVSFARSLVAASGSSSRSCRLVVTPSLQEGTEGPASARPASTGLLVLSARRLAAQLGRSRGLLAAARDRLASLPALPLTELTAIAQVAATDKVPAASVRKLATDQVTTAIAGKEAEVRLCRVAVEGLAFLLWRHLEHYLLYTGAAAAAGPSTPFQAAFGRLNSAPPEVGAVSFAHKAGFTQADLDRLKTDAVTSLNEAFFDKISEGAEAADAASSGASAGFLQSVLRRTQRLATLHTQ